MSIFNINYHQCPEIIKNIIHEKFMFNSWSFSESRVWRCEANVFKYFLDRFLIRFLFDFEALNGPTPS